MKLNNKGNSVFVVLAASLVLSIASIQFVRNVNNAIFHSSLVQRRVDAYNIAETVYNHVYSTNRSTFIDADDGLNWIGRYDVSNCSSTEGDGSLLTIFDEALCNSLLNQSVNDYDFDNIYFYVYRLNVSTIAEFPASDAPQSLKNYVASANPDSDSIFIHRIAVCVEYFEESNDASTILYHGYLLR